MLEMKTCVYIDGFNLYYGALKRTPYKWLNVRSLVEELLPSEHSIEKIRYFTARASGSSDPGVPRRQQIYFNALSSIRELEIHLGSFLNKNIWRPIVTLPIQDKVINSPESVILPAGHHDVLFDDNSKVLIVGEYPVKGSKRRRKVKRPPNNALVAEVHAMEEKGSDVNLASHLINDAWKELYNVAVVISNDTDLVTPIRMVTTERDKTVYLVCPSKYGASKPMVKVATYVRHINNTVLAKAQFPEIIPETTIRKPTEW